MIVFLGDVHGFFDRVADVSHLYEGNATAIVQVGDFGYYPQTLSRLAQYHFPTPIYWIDGNHEYYPLITPLWDKTEPVKVLPNVYYVPRGCVVELDGVRIGCLGGAASVDKAYRKAYADWWPEEVTRPIDGERLLQHGPVDLLVTHAPPQFIVDKHFNPADLERHWGLSRNWRDPSAAIVEDVWNQLGQPPLICGHMHRSVVDGVVRILDINEVYEFPPRS